MKAKDKQVIKFMSHGTYESVAGISCAGCVAHKDNEVTSLCKAISKFSNCEGVIWKEQVNTSQPTTH